MQGAVFTPSFQIGIKMIPIQNICKEGNQLVNGRSSFGPGRVARALLKGKPEYIRRCSCPGGPISFNIMEAIEVAKDISDKLIRKAGKNPNLRKGIRD